MKHPISQNMTREPVTIGSHVTIQEAQEVMRMWGMRHLPVVNDDNKLVGLVSDRDFSRTFMTKLKGADSVSEIMTGNPYSVLSDTPIAIVVETMATNKYGSVVVVDPDRHVRGIFTTTDALNILATLFRDPTNDSYRLLRIEDYLLQPRYSAS